MRILHVVASLDPEAGGPALVTVRLAAAQAAAGHDTRILSYCDTDSEVRIKKSTEGVPGVSFVHFEYIRSPTVVERISGLRAKSAVQRLIQESDWVHCHGIWEPLVFHTMREAHRQCVPYCVRTAGMLAPWSLAQKSTKKSLALRLGYRNALNRAAFIQALNADEARLMEPVGLTVPIKIVPNGIFEDEIFPLPERGRFIAQYPVIGKAPFVLFLARLHHVKGLDVLLPAFQILASNHPDVCLVIAGPDDGEGARLARAMAASPVKRRIFFVGPLYGREKFEALVDATVFCLPSRQEGFSVAVLEALATGLPAVISEQVNFPEVAEVGAGVVVKLEARDVADAIDRILKDSTRRSAMSEAATRLALDKFTWPSVCNRMLACYREHSVRTDD